MAGMNWNCIAWIVPSCSLKEWNTYCSLSHGTSDHGLSRSHFSRGRFLFKYILISIQTRDRRDFLGLNHNSSLTFSLLSLRDSSPHLSVTANLVMSLAKIFHSYQISFHHKTCVPQPSNLHLNQHPNLHLPPVLYHNPSPRPLPLTTLTHHPSSMQK